MLSKLRKLLGKIADLVIKGRQAGLYDKGPVVPVDRNDKDFHRTGPR